MMEPLRKVETAPTRSTQTAGHLPQNRLIIPKLKIDAPIIWEVTENEILERLKDGVAHYKGTNLPGENGNVFITGHSSNFWWAEGNYKQIFALLDELEIGNKIYITYDKTLYIYQVEEKKIVNPTQIETLSPADHSVLSLMTCYPIGTTINRLVVTAKQITPEPQKERIQREQIKPGHLPVIR
jgi:sortase A